MAALAAVALALPLVIRCMGTAPSAPALESDARLRVGLAPNRAWSPTDSIRFTITGNDGTLLARETFAYAARRAALAPLPCGIAVKVLIEGFGPDGALLFTGGMDIASLACDTMTVEVADSQVTPMPPSRLTASAPAEGTVSLTWHDNAHNERFFAVERATDSAGAFVALDSTSDTFYVDAGLAPDTRYRYQIRAVNAAGQSPALVSTVVTTQPADTSGPRLSLLSHSARDTIHTRQVTLFGTVGDPAGVASVKYGTQSLVVIDGYWSLPAVAVTGDSLRLQITAIDKTPRANATRLPVTLFYADSIVDSAPPRITLMSHTNPDTVSAGYVTLFGTISDDAGVYALTVDSAPVVPDGFVWHSQPVALERGVNTVVIRATDGSTNHNDTLIEVVLWYADPCADTTPPRIAVLSHTDPDTVSTRLVTVFGSVSDPDGISLFSYNDTPLTLNDNVWEVGGYYLGDGRNRLILRARDRCSSPHAAIDTLTIWYVPTYVDSANHAPYFTVNPTNLSATMKAGQTYQRNLSARDSDPYDRLAFTVGQPLSLVDDSTVVWVPALGDTGRHQTYALVLDQDSARDSIAWTITVLDPQVNTAPVFATKRADLEDSVMVGLTYRDTVLAADVDQNSGITYRLVDSPAGITVGAATGIVVWKPDTVAIGLHILTVEAVDDSGATAQLSWPVMVYDPALPVVDAGRDTTVSVNDTVRLHGKATSVSGRIATYEWDIGAKGSFAAVSTSDTAIRAGDTPVDAYRCVFRATDDYGRKAQDTMIVRVIADPPVARAGSDTVVWLGEVYLLAGTGTDQYGRVVRYEWDIGLAGTFVESPDGRYAGTAPRAGGPLRCALRVTDDDGKQALDTLTVHVVGETMRRISGGGGTGAEREWIAFTMGSTAGESDEAPVHPVTIAAFLIDSTEVTQEEYQQVMKGVNPSTFVGPRRPVDGATWYDALLFCNARGRRDGYDTVYTYTSTSGTHGAGSILGGVQVHYDRIGYRLPTEAEWEYACGAASNSAFYWGDDTIPASQYAWYEYNAGATTHEVSCGKPNAFGLYDVAGNVWEWCNDWHSLTYYQECAAQDTVRSPAGPLTGSTRVIRGGSWQDGATELRTANRGLGLPSWSSSFVGFRCVLPLR